MTGSSRRQPPPTGVSSVSARRLVVARSEDLVIVRQTVQKLARELGFDPFAVAAVTTATSELTRNILRHAESGHALVEEVAAAQRRGVRVTFSDSGPGIADIAHAMAGGNSTAGTLGLGLIGSKRLVDTLTIDSVVGVGTTVTITKWTPHPLPR